MNVLLEGTFRELNERKDFILIFCVLASHTSHVACGHLAPVVQSAGQDRYAAAACAVCATVVRQHTAPFG